MAWHSGEPVGDKAIKELVYFMPANWQYIEAAFGRDHVFPGTYGSTSGKHKAGECRVVFYGPAASVAALTTPVSGAIAYDTEYYRFVYYDGSAWKSFDNLLHRKNASMTGDLVVEGSMLDGRDPSVDGEKLDTMTALSTCTGTSMASVMSNGETLEKPPVPSGVTYEDSEMFWAAHQRYIGLYVGGILSQQGCNTYILGTGQVIVVPSVAGKTAHAMGVGVKTA